MSVIAKRERREHSDTPAAGDTSDLLALHNQIANRIKRSR